MSWKPTFLLLLLAGALFAFIYTVERHKIPASQSNQEPERLVAINPAQVTNIQVRMTNELVLRAERSNEMWRLVAPISYPAQVYAIEGLLQQLAEVRPPTSISPDELKAGGKTIADFGLDVPQATLTLFHNGGRSEVRFGAKTATGDQVYVQLLDRPNIFVVGADLLKRVPRQADSWRDVALVGTTWNRFEIRLPGRTIALNWDKTNNYTLTKPFAARADMPRVEALLRKVLGNPVQQFVSDEPRIDLEPFGLKTPEAELALGLGTNEVAVVQFGKSPTNDSSLVYARCLSHTNIVLVSKAALEALQVPANDLRDRHLLHFATNEIDTLEVIGQENFAVRRQSSGQWAVIEPEATMVDGEMMRGLLLSMQQLEGTVEKDLVTDFASYGLTPPAHQYLLKTTFTNNTGAITNRITAKIELSSPQTGKIFIRRGDEGMTVYSIAPNELEALPVAAWQLRDRRVWTFTTNQVMKITVSQKGASQSLVRSSAGKWALGENSQGIINSFAVEELVYRLGELQAERWIARGETNRAQYGFTGETPQLTIELKVGEKPYVLNLELGGATSAQFPLALATLDGQPYIFKFPLKLYVKLLSDLITPLMRTS